MPVVQNHDRERDHQGEGQTLTEHQAGVGRSGGGEIAVDSAADESCWPKDQGGAFPTKPSRKNIILKTANGGERGHYGENDITFKDQLSGDILGLKFQVTDVRKPLLAVRRLVERGNVSQFGPEPEQNYILHVESGRKIMMEKKGGSFIINANFVQKVEAATAGFSGRPGEPRGSSRKTHMCLWS